MGYQCYEMDGRDQGYGVPAECDHPECNEEITRGMGFSCGGDPTENCGLFFCEDHRKYDLDPEADFTDDNRHTFGVCERCANNLAPFEPKPDIEFWKAWKMNHPTWKEWREENPAFVRENSHLIGNEEVMSILEEEF